MAGVDDAKRRSGAQSTISPKAVVAWFERGTDAPDPCSCPSSRMVEGRDAARRNDLVIAKSKATDLAPAITSAQNCDVNR